MSEMLQLPIHIQIAVAGGYMGYVTAYAGLRSGHTMRDTLLLTLVFGALPALAWPFLSDWSGDRHHLRIAAGLVSLALPVLAGALWRRRGRAFWYNLLNRLGVHVEDGLSSGWDSLTQHPGLRVMQITVRTTDGTELFCESVPNHVNSECAFSSLDKFCPLFGNDGSVVMVVDEEDTATGEKSQRTDQVNSEWGARLTYIPAHMIERVELRVCDAT